MVTNYLQIFCWKKQRGEKQASECLWQIVFGSVICSQRTVGLTTLNPWNLWRLPMENNRVQKSIWNCRLPPVSEQWYTRCEDTVRGLENSQPAVKMLEAGGKHWWMGSFILLALVSKASMSHYITTTSSLAALLGVIAKISCVQKSLAESLAGLRRKTF